VPDFDVIVIGAGPAGEVLAGRTAAGGLSTAIVEKRLVGGECGFYACMPSKALLHPGEVLDEIRHVAGAREAAGGQLAVQAVLDNRDSIISDLDDSSQVSWLEDNDISLFRGHGRIAGEKRVVVGDEELLARIAVVIAIGSEPTLPDVEGLSHANPWTNREATGGTFWGAESEGNSQLVIDKHRRVVVGATFTGSGVQDMLQAATFAVVGELTLEQLWHGIAPFPTRSEVWLNLLETTGL
jgi:pyruvate/2-oxoglutarate dehydrogenase complex dihydrolipoamide dehydrogenase (E3) component